MEDISVTSSPPQLKRPAPHDEMSGERPLNLKGTQFLIPTPPGTTGSDDSPARMVRELSPTSTLSSIQDLSSVGNPEAHNLGSNSKSTNGAPPAKKRKLTPAEKAEQQRLKEVKAQEKAELKRTKDEEKRVKDEEKRRKAEEREVKKREKELEEERKHQEKLKKERSQMRLGTFFQRPATTTQDDIDNQAPSPGGFTTRRRSLSLETFDNVQDQIVKTTPKKTASSTEDPPKAAQPIISDYRKYFLPYEPKPHTVLPTQAVIAGPESLEAQARFDAELQATPEQFDLGICPTYATLREHFKSPRGGRRGLSVVRTRSLYEQIQGSSQRPIDLTKAGQQGDPLREVANLSMRHLWFWEDVRPAYFGTYTRITSPSVIRKLRLNPLARERPDTNYEWDSDAEWEEPDNDDEEIGIDDEDEESNGDEDEMEGFLDDEDDELKTRRRLVVDEKVAHSTGLCWEDKNGKLVVPADSSPSRAMRGLRLQFLLPDFQGKSIDPFSTAYWQKEEPVKDNKLLRPPLGERSSNTASVKPDNGWPIVDSPKPQSNVKKGMKPGAQKTMTAEELDRFKAEVVGSVLGKQELLNKLKTSFPNLTTVLVKETLGDNFAQVGKSKAEKKWVYVGTS